MMLGRISGVSVALLRQRCGPWYPRITLAPSPRPIWPDAPLSKSDLHRVSANCINPGASAISHPESGRNTGLEYRDERGASVVKGARAQNLRRLLKPRHVCIVGGQAM